MKARPELSADGQILTVSVPLQIRKRGGRKEIVAPDGPPVAWGPPIRVDNTLVKAVARAHRWQRMLEDGTHATLRDLAAAENISPSYVSRLMQLTLLAPPLVENVINGLIGATEGGNVSGRCGQCWIDQLRVSFR